MLGERSTTSCSEGWSRGRRVPTTRHTASSSEPAPTRRPRRLPWRAAGRGQGHARRRRSRVIRGFLTVAGLEAICTADVIVHDRLAPLDALRHVRADAVVIDVGKIPRGDFTPQETINAVLVEHALARPGRPAAQGRRQLRLRSRRRGGRGVRGGRDPCRRRAGGVVEHRSTCPRRHPRHSPGARAGLHRGQWTRGARRPAARSTGERSPAPTRPSSCSWGWPPSAPSPPSSSPTASPRTRLRPVADAACRDAVGPSHAVPHRPRVRLGGLGAPAVAVVGSVAALDVLAGR